MAGLQTSRFVATHWLSKVHGGWPGPQTKGMVMWQSVWLAAELYAML